MAVGNTFGATALSSYGGFWISFAIILTPGGFNIENTLDAAGPEQFNNSLGLFLMVHPSLPPPFFLNFKDEFMIII
jgi:succinate-acetate transporter protein